MAARLTPAQIAARARAYGLDPQAVLQVAGAEGLSGGIGDGGHAYGPFQLNNAGGVITGSHPGVNDPATQAWAWSPQGVDYALSRISKVARGQRGAQAVRSIVTQFERPADPTGEITRALGSGGAGAGASFSPAPAASTSPAAQAAPQLDPRQLLSALSGASTGGDYTGFYRQLGQQRQQQQTQPRVQGVSASLAPGGPAAPPLRNFKAGSPVADLTSKSAEHETMGLAGYPAYDYFAPAGSPAVAPVSGKVVRLSGHDPRLGPTQGPHGPLGWSVYIQGDDGHTYYLTHMGSRSVKPGQAVKAGQPIGSVANYAKYGTPNHIHMGVH